MQDIKLPLICIACSKAITAETRPGIIDANGDPKHDNCATAQEVLNHMDGKAPMLSDKYYEEVSE